MTLYKYQGAGNDFLIADNRDGSIKLTADEIAAICDRRYGVGADGLMLLEKASQEYDFRMVYYNSDGSGGMMCGNGGRCIVAFAARCGIKSFHFEAVDGDHDAQILSVDGSTAIVKLRMKDVEEIKFYDSLEINGCFLDTGTRHLVCHISDVMDYPIVEEGRRLRYHSEFAPIGTNVNFVEEKGEYLQVRTYEKGVEDETFACGTGITASAIAHWHCSNKECRNGCLVHQPICALKDALAVDFVPTKNGAREVYLTGPATYVAKILI